MTTKSAVWICGVALLIFLVLFRIEIKFEFSLPQDRQELDAGREEEFRTCVEKRDAEIHRVAFSTIDNPDVQREILAAGKEKAVAACRELHPEVRISVAQPFRFNLIDLEFRF